MESRLYKLQFLNSSSHKYRKIQNYQFEKTSFKKKKQKECVN